MFQGLFRIDGFVKMKAPQVRNEALNDHVERIPVQLPGLPELSFLPDVPACQTEQIQPLFTALKEYNVLKHAATVVFQITEGDESMLLRALIFDVHDHKVDLLSLGQELQSRVESLLPESRMQVLPLPYKTYKGVWQKVDRAQKKFFGAS